MSTMKRMALLTSIALIGGAYNPMAGESIPLPEPKQPPKRTKPLLSYGNGKIEYKFETNWGSASIWADNAKSANKKLRTLIGINSSLKIKI